MTPEEQSNFTMEFSCTQCAQFKAVRKMQRDFIEYYNLMKLYVK